MPPEDLNHALTTAVKELRVAIKELETIFVRKDVYASDQRGVERLLADLREDVREVKDECEQIVKDRTADRRLIFTAIAAPVLILIIQLYLRSQGVA